VRGLHNLLAFVALTAVFVVFCPPVAALAAPKFVAPVDAAVSREFDLSNGEFAAGGHRGIDYSVPEGSPVRASGVGVVSFAGSTPEGPYVSITHDGGVKTTYSLGEIAVSAGQEVGRGTIIGSSGIGHDNSGPLLHFGALIDGKYIDPLLLLGDFEDITELISLAEIQGSAAPAGSRLASAVTLPEFGAGIAPPDLAPFDPGAGFAPFGPGTAPDGAPLPPNHRPEVVPIPRPLPEQIQIGPSGPPTLRGPPLPSRFFRDDFTGEGGAGDGPQFDPRTGLPLFNAPKLVERWWIGLTGAERKTLIDRYPVKIGHLVGVPVEARDRANRLALSRKIKELEAMKRKRDEFLKGFPEARSLHDHQTWLSKVSPKLAGYYEGFIGLTPWRRRMTALSRELAGAKNLQRQLVEIAKDPRNRLDPSDVYLLELDTDAGFGDGQAVVAFGNPTVAEHIGVVVPGINNSLLDVENPMGDAAALRSVVFDNEGIDAMNDTSTTMWLGYDTPNGLLDASNKAEAREGAARLEKFVDGIRASHAEPGIRRGYATRTLRDPHITGFGHSYGSAVSGMATKRGMDIDDLALLGSPGGGVLYGSELASINREVWAARTSDDPIRFVPPVLGHDPMDADFGSDYLPLDVTQMGHGGYYDRGSKGLENMAWLLTGRYENIEEEIND
jgi:hypothetical protein